MWRFSKLVALTLLSASAMQAGAHERSDNPWNWSGFITQGWTISDHNNFFGNSSDSNGSFNYRELGVNASYQLNNQVRLNGQAISRWAGETDDGDPRIDYLFADWSWLQRSDLQAGLKLGRIKNPIGFFNETRDVAFTRPSALLPQSIYLDRVRELALTSDGLGGYLRNSFDNGNLQIDFIWGEPQMGPNSERSLLGRNWDGKFDDADLGLVRALYEHDGGRVRLAVTLVDASTHFTGTGSDPFTSGEVDFSLVGYSAQYNMEQWSLTAEFVEETVDRKGFNSVFQPSKNTIEAYYLQVDYRVDDKWTLFGRYDEVVVDKTDPDGRRFNLLTGLPAHQRFGKDWTLGAGYRYSSRLLLRGEWHLVDGTAWLSRPDNPDPAELEKNWNLLLFQASYRF